MRQQQSDVRGIKPEMKRSSGRVLSFTILLAIYGGPALSAPQYETVINFACRAATPTAANPCGLNWLTADPRGTFLYGEASYCGKYGQGTIVKLQPPAPGKASWDYTTLYTLDADLVPNSGGFPTGGLAVDPSSGALYGVTEYGGPYNENNRYKNGNGTLFRLKPNGAKFTFSVLHNFNGFDGSLPLDGPTLDSAGNIVGETPYGGFGFSSASVANDIGSGVVYTLAPAVQGQWPLKALERFPYPTRGTAPAGRLLSDASGKLFGVTQSGGAYGAGTVYMVDPNARGGLGARTVIYHFRGIGPKPWGVGNFQDGSTPFSGLITDAAGNLYGTTRNGGSAGSPKTGGLGTVYMLSHNGSNAWKETILHNFAGRPNDGAGPYAELVLVKGVLYGITEYGGPGAVQEGTIFSLTPPATGKTAWTYKVVYNFDGATDGNPQQSPLVSDAKGNLYGLTNGPTGVCAQMFKLKP